MLFDQKRHFYHAVLSVAVDGNYFILDNKRDPVLPDSRLPDYQPPFSIADGKGYLHGLRAGNKQVASRMPLEKVAPGEGGTLRPERRMSEATARRGRFFRFLGRSVAGNIAQPSPCEDS
ncbi:hypothetical protein EV129_112118 [Rhizobium azibense]|uniref:Uncharacterized protein n=1 Tax=Rhizobium azibense TaxID=1136135 RepID=A0A4R3RLE5_9HYPH|nr:hypothetical protein EV129_112118 [Rhizobium azibense]